MAQIIERVQGHYEVQDVQFGKVYKWRPEGVVVECECGRTRTLTASKRVCDGCGEDHGSLVQEALEEDGDEVDEGVAHPWRSLRPYYEPTRGT